jgi:thioredoxin reductase
MSTTYDVVIVGGGPAGLSAALALGRARRRLLLCDAGPRRNARAHAVQNFLTRDGTEPSEFRRIAREQLAEYPNIEFLEASVDSIAPRGAMFVVGVGGSQVNTRRVLLCTGVSDEPLMIPGFDELWGRSIFQCPYCHGWERRNQRFGYLAAHAETHDFELLLQHWTPHVTLFTQGLFTLSDARLAALSALGVVVETRHVAELSYDDDHGEPSLRAVRLVGGGEVACDALFVHPKQKTVPLVDSLGLATDESGFIAVDPMTRQTSVAGIYAAGDVTTRMQAAILAAASGMQAAAALNHGLIVR